MPRAGSKKGRGRGDQESRQTQDYPYPPPVLSRYPTRSSRGVVPQLLAMPPSGSITSNPPLRSALRILRRDRETAEAPPLHSQPTVDYPVSENGLEDVKVEPSSPIVSPTPSSLGPCSEHKMDLDALRAKIASQVEGAEQVAVQPPSQQDVDGNTQPPGQNSEVPRDKLRAPLKIKAKDGGPPSPAHSLNMTEFAKGLKHESEDDHDEVVSAPPGLDYDYVHGHKVKKGNAGLVNAIFEKYGDITKECEVTPSFKSFFLECVCDVYRRLEEKTLHTITRADIKGMVVELKCCGDQKVNVGWLLEKLGQISETTSSSQNQKYLMVKGKAEKCLEANTRIEEDLEQQRTHIRLIKNRMSELEREKQENQVKANEFTNIAIEIKTSANALAKSLVHGLL